ncbi:MAG: uracil phosphoribosyltransferase [Bdellovibrionales bacterium]
MSADFPSLHIVEHPLIAHKLTQMRDKERQPISFRGLLREITLLMTFEALRDLPLSVTSIETPLTTMKAPVLAGPAPSIIPILRAGLGMSDPLSELFPTASIGHIGIRRDPETKEAIEYMVKLPKPEGQPYIIVDPMLATGHSLIHACGVLNEHGVPDKQIRVMALLAAPEGVRAFMAKHPDVRIYCAALDSHLDENAYIVPGLGDAGDRLFGTLD